MKAYLFTNEQNYAAKKAKCTIAGVTLRDAWYTKEVAKTCTRHFIFRAKIN